MSYLLAVTGKGGVGKTTLSSLLISRLIANGNAPVLAVDADPNTCLDLALGVQVEKTIGGVREEARQIAGQGMSAGISKQELLQLKIAESLVEANDFDLIAMGRSEGPGCYCYANNVLKSALAEIAHEYPYVVLDNEAGLENLSRRIVHQVDLLIMVADPSRRGRDTLKRLHEMTAEMEIVYKKLAVFINRIRTADSTPAYLQEIKDEIGADFVVPLPDNAQLAEYAENGQSVFQLPTDNPVVVRLDAFLQEVGLGEVGVGDENFVKKTKL